MGVDVSRVGPTPITVYMFDIFCDSQEVLESNFLNLWGFLIPTAGLQAKLQLCLFIQGVLFYLYTLDMLYIVKV